jgi:hypothetical protein
MKEDLLNILVAANDPAATVAGIIQAIYDRLEKYRMDIHLNVVLCIDPSKAPEGLTPFVVCHRLTDVVRFHMEYKCTFYISDEFQIYGEHAESIMTYLKSKRIDILQYKYFKENKL